MFYCIIMNIFFDSIIFIFLIVDVALIITLVHQIFHIVRRKQPYALRCFVCVIVLIIAVVAGGVVTYGSFIEPRRLIVHEESLVLRDGGEHHMRIAFAADFHAGPYLSKSFVERVARTINAEAPDVVLLGGDYVSFGENDALGTLQSLESLGAPQGIYAVLGNHDYLGDASEVESALTALGIHVLKNTNAVVGEEAQLAIAGVDDLWFGTVDIGAALAGIPEEMPRILLAHNPDTVYAVGDHPIDAIFSGHTHGGQIRFPGIGPLIPIPTVLGKDFATGVFAWYETPFVITQGIGTIGTRARLFTPPEIMILDVEF